MISSKGDTTITRRRESGQREDGVSQRRFFIDTDTASDDAVAILMALQWTDVTVEGISR